MVSCGAHQCQPPFEALGTVKEQLDLISGKKAGLPLCGQEGLEAGRMAEGRRQEDAGEEQAGTADMPAAKIGRSGPALNAER